MSELDSPFASEEPLLLPALKAAAGGLASRAQSRASPAARNGLHPLSPNAPLLESFADLLQGHVQFRENEIFSVARNCLDDGLPWPSSPPTDRRPAPLSGGGVRIEGRSRGSLRQPSRGVAPGDRVGRPAGIDLGGEGFPRRPRRSCPR